MSSLALFTRVLRLLQGFLLLLAQAGCLIGTALARHCQGWRGLSSLSRVCGCPLPSLLMFSEC